MSATGRNLPGNERHENDYYETPGWVTRAILPYLRIPTRVIDAGAGKSWAILRECRHFWPHATCIGLDTDPAAASGVMGVYQDDFLASKVHETFIPDLIISNPPYALAQEFAEKALRATWGEVAFLLRLPWLASVKRFEFHRAHPADIFVLPKRPSFTGGGTDATDYAWFVWGRDRGNRWQVLTPPTPEDLAPGSNFTPSGPR